MCFGRWSVPFLFWVCVLLAAPPALPAAPSSIAPDPVSPIHEPEINVPACAVIVDGEAGTITVAGDYAEFGAASTRFHVFAPPGTESFGLMAGLCYAGAQPSQGPPVGDEPSPLMGVPWGTSGSPVYAAGFVYVWPPDDEILLATVGPNSSGEYIDVIVMGVRSNSQVTGSLDAHEELALYSHGTDISDYVGKGKWYWIHCDKSVRHAPQSGLWREAAQESGWGNAAKTTFTLHERCGLTSTMKGWMLQPDATKQVFVPITEVERGNGSCAVTVQGTYGSLGAKDGRFRIYAPTGTSTFGPLSGLIDDGTDRTVSARSTRCLYGGYRSDSPVAGLFDVQGWFNANTAYANWLANPIGNQPPKPAKEPFILARQEGWNFAGLQYTLHRHYDPVLMQFTSPDPIASPFYNLYGYCGNNPSGAFDPDGLQMEPSAKSGYPQIDRGLDGGGGGGGGSSGGTVSGGGGWYGGMGGGWASGGGGILAPESTNYGSPIGIVLERGIDSFQRSVARDKELSKSGLSEPARVGLFVLFTIADTLPSGSWAEAVSNTDSITGRTLTQDELRAKALQATFEIGTLGLPAASGAAGTTWRGMGGRLRTLHSKANAKYTWGKPPGGHWKDGVSHKLRVKMKAPPGSELHHWLIPQKQWGSGVPNYIKNRRWNVVLTANRAAHARIDTAFSVKGVRPYPLPLRPFIAMPNWARAATGAGTGASAYRAYELLGDD